MTTKKANRKTELPLVEILQYKESSKAWEDLITEDFSKNKIVFEYQKNALKNIVKLLYQYYKEYNADKSQFLHIYKNLDPKLLHELNLKINKRPIERILEEYDKEFPIIDSKVEFKYFINRTSIWMATGSGKTLVIIKLIEVLAKLIQYNQIPPNKILFLTSREDLLEQFETQVEEFNKYNDYKILLHDLKNFENILYSTQLKSDYEIDVFYYRSDLIHDEQKENQLDFRNIDNNGNWYIILDEAHKGENEDSKRKIYYSILSRNGFLFNFSATFTDQIDFVTCAYNFNLEKFIEAGYGKNIYLSQTNIEGLTKQEDFSEEEKRIILLKILILFTLIKKSKQKLGNYYHHPLMLTLVNSVNTEDSDLELFFKELEKIASQKIETDLLEKAKRDLINEVQGRTLFSKINIQLDTIETQSITVEDIIKYIFNSQNPGKIEVLKIPGNKQELVFKLQTSDTPFALIKIGDITEWIKNKLKNYEIIEKFENESVFKNINNNNAINILMGSRAFYEGWDSNRPNIILYINIGKGIDSKKFVLQSIGRGVRIEPIPNKRGRLDILYPSKLTDEEKNFYLNIDNNAKNLLETLFVFGTKADNLQEIINTLQELEPEEEPIGKYFEITPNASEKLLLIPFYTKSSKMLIENAYIRKFLIHPDDYKIFKEYITNIDDKILILKYDIAPKVLKIIREHINKLTYTQSDQSFFEINGNIIPIKNIDSIIKNVFNHFSARIEEFDKFKKLENEIIHFKQIKVSKQKAEEIKNLIEKVKYYPKLKQEEQKLQKELKENKITIEQYTESIKSLSQITQVSTYEKLRIRYLSEHYYIPLIISTDDKINYINHVINTESERLFIDNLIQHLQNEENIFYQYDWWLFSKIDESIDEVYIPYYDSYSNRVSKFKPDFIFWLVRGNEYHIVFVDPKSTEFESANRKIAGFKNTFTQINYKYQNYNIKVHLRLLTNDKNKIQHNVYENYWYELNNIKEIFNLT